MTITGPLYAGTAQTTTGIGTVAWSIGDLTADDNNRCMADLPAGVLSNYLEMPFDFSAIPDTDIINALLVELMRSGESGNRIGDYLVQWKIAGTLTGDNKAIATNWGGTDALTVYGNLTTDKWGLTITGADLKAANTYLVLVAQNEASGTWEARLDFARLTVLHSPTAPTFNPVWATHNNQVIA